MILCPGLVLKKYSEFIIKNGNNMVELELCLEEAIHQGDDYKRPRVALNHHHATTTMLHCQVCWISTKHSALLPRPKSSHFGLRDCGPWFSNMSFSKLQTGFHIVHYSNIKPNFVECPVSGYPVNRFTPAPSEIAFGLLVALMTSPLFTWSTDQ